MNNTIASKMESVLYEPKIEFLVTDCMDFMKECDDGQFDLAIVGPTYGIKFH